VHQIITHERYDTITHVNDIALIKLSEAVPMAKHIRPACTPNNIGPALTVGSWGPYSGSQCYSVGWGATRGRWQNQRKKSFE